MATINNQSPDEDRRREIALELMEAYVSLTCCCILFRLFCFSPFITFLLVFLILDMFSWLERKSMKKNRFMISFLHFVFRDCAKVKVFV